MAPILRSIALISALALSQNALSEEPVAPAPSPAYSATTTASPDPATTPVPSPASETSSVPAAAAPILVYAKQKSLSYVDDVVAAPDGSVSMRIQSAWTGFRIDQLSDGTCQMTTQRAESYEPVRKLGSTFQRPVLKSSTEAIACPSTARDRREIQFITAVAGAPDCKMPADTANPGPGECSVEVSRIELGSRIVSDNGVCYEINTDLNEIKSFRYNQSVSIDLPQVSAIRRIIDPAFCSHPDAPAKAQPQPQTQPEAPQADPSFSRSP